MEDYIYFSKEDAEKMIRLYQEMVGKKYTDGITQKEHAIVKIDIMPANPDIRNRMFKMSLDHLVEFSEIEKLIENITEFTLCAFVIQKPIDGLPPVPMLLPLQLVVDADSRELAYGFGIVL